MNFLLQKSTEKIDARVSKEAKEYIEVISELRGMSQSKYIKLAIQNQIKSDIGSFGVKELTPKTPQP